MKPFYFLLLGACLSSVDFEQQDSDVTSGWLVVEDELTTSTEGVIETETERVEENSSDAAADEGIVTTTTTVTSEMSGVRELMDRIAEDDDSHHDYLLYQAQIGFILVLVAGVMYAYMNNE
jgi:hypothetical protein